MYPVKQAPDNSNIFIQCEWDECSYLVYWKSSFERLKRSYRFGCMMNHKQQNDNKEKQERISQQIEFTKNNLQERMISAKSALDQAIADCDACRKEALNLVRINRERANADRNLKGKKDHSGYVLRQSRQKEVYDRDLDESVLLWETEIQTPYHSRFQLELVQTQVELEFIDTDLFRKGLGICQSWQDDCNSFFLSANSEMQEENCLLSILYRRDFRNGYWTIVFTHTKPLNSNLPTVVLAAP